MFSGDWTDYKELHPSTAARVVGISISTLVRDLGKAAIGAEAGAPEDWLVEPEAGRIPVHAEPAGTEYDEAVVFGNGETAVGAVFPTLAVTVDEVAASSGGGLANGPVNYRFDPPGSRPAAGPWFGGGRPTLVGCFEKATDAGRRWHGECRREELAGDLRRGRLAPAGATADTG